MKPSAKPTSIRLPDDLRDKIEKMAQAEHRSLSNAIEVALIRYFSCEGRKDKHP